VTHPDLPEPVVHQMTVSGRDIDSIIDNLTIKGALLGQLRRTRKAEYTDVHGAIHQFELIPLIDVIEVPKRKETECPSP
jgi:hypothetical protein